MWNCLALLRILILIYLSLIPLYLSSPINVKPTDINTMGSEYFNTPQPQIPVLDYILSIWLWLITTKTPTWMQYVPKNSPCGLSVSCLLWSLQLLSFLDLLANSNLSPFSESTGKVIGGFFSDSPAIFFWTFTSAGHFLRISKAYLL